LLRPEIVDEQPLYGIPVSIKDFFDLKGKISLTKNWDLLATKIRNI